MADNQATAPVPAKGGSTSNTSVTSYFSSAWELTTKHVNLWVSLVLLAVIPAVIIGFVVALLFDLDSDMFVGQAAPVTDFGDLGTILGAMMVWTILVGLYNVFIYGAQINAFLETNRSKGYTIQQAIEAGKANFGRLLVLFILMAVFIMLGFVALIIPGIVLSILFCYAPLVSVDQKLGAMESLKKSMNMVTGNFGKLFIFAVLAFLVAIGISIVAGIVIAILPDALGSILNAFVNGVMTIFFGLAFTKLYLAVKA